MIDAPLDVELAPAQDAPRVARRLLTQWMEPDLTDGVLARARLLVSELVTNAVTHGRGRIRLKARLSGHRILVEVIDHGDGFADEFRERDFQMPGAEGWGLTIVDAESSCWGIDPESSHVWFEIERPGTRRARPTDPSSERSSRTMSSRPTSPTSSNSRRTWGDPSTMTSRWSRS